MSLQTQVPSHPNVEPLSLPTWGSPAEFLASRYSAELKILQSLTDERYGTAYIYYTRYRILNRIATEIGLHIHRPSQMAMVDNVRLTYQALFEWAEVNSGSFGNVKAQIVEGEQIRQELSRLSSPTQQQTTLLQHLNCLATDPDLTATVARPASLGWSLSTLRSHTVIYRARHQQRPVGPR
ncbi:hypothetical protein GGX14DRAFT_557420 [Mycena pura]|uniref:Uncharacterized protein n=1 Tax=Mycena pura TaxID=153505 RepID=A0AAD6YNH7_9AGAR|nr:hypothetical protein GGX14DRAFT_571770 [Mycena pura]KAJ7224561.1 hypothetical protein GGX14DRAFT_557420 [Mycena pura]